MFTLDIDGMPFAVVNLPRHEAQDFFESAFKGCVGEVAAVTRAASPKEKRQLVRSYKCKLSAGLVKVHQFDGFHALLVFETPPGTIVAHSWLQAP